MDRKKLVLNQRKELISDAARIVRERLSKQEMLTLLTALHTAKNELLLALVETYEEKTE